MWVLSETVMFFHIAQKYNYTIWLRVAQHWRILEMIWWSKLNLPYFMSIWHLFAQVLGNCVQGPEIVPCIFILLTPHLGINVHHWQMNRGNPEWAHRQLPYVVCGSHNQLVRQPVSRSACCMVIAVVIGLLPKFTDKSVSQSVNIIHNNIVWLQYMNINFWIIYFVQPSEMGLTLTIVVSAHGSHVM